jgi:Fe-S-cluster containining protein
VTSTVTTATGRSERQMERGQLFMHTAFAEIHRRLRETEVLLHALMDVLLRGKQVTEEEIWAAVPAVTAGLAVDPTALGVTVGAEPVAPVAAVEPVDCASRMPVCHAVCCRLDFALSVPEIEAGAVRWDLGRPYFIRHEADGVCTHNDRRAGGCEVYEDRPAVCRRYNCRDDGRIWKDFDSMELNSEWISENLASERPRPTAVFLPIPVFRERS